MTNKYAEGSFPATPITRPANGSTSPRRWRSSAPKSCSARSFPTSSQTGSQRTRVGRCFWRCCSRPDNLHGSEIAPAAISPTRARQHLPANGSRRKALHCTPRGTSSSTWRGRPRAPRSWQPKLITRRLEISRAWDFNASRDRRLCGAYFLVDGAFCGLVAAARLHRRLPYAMARPPPRTNRLAVRRGGLMLWMVDDETRQEVIPRVPGLQGGFADGCDRAEKAGRLRRGRCGRDFKVYAKNGVENARALAASCAPMASTSSPAAPTPFDGWRISATRGEGQCVGEGLGRRRSPATKNGFRFDLNPVVHPRAFDTATTAGHARILASTHSQQGRRHDR